MKPPLHPPLGPGLPYRLAECALAAGLLLHPPNATGDETMVRDNGARIRGGPHPTLFDVTFAQEAFVAVGDDGAIATSIDGQNWVWRECEGRSHLRSVVWGGDRWIAVGDGGTILTSTDLVDWKPQKTPAARALHDVTFSDCLYVVVGDDGLAMTSFDGVEWTRRDTGSTKGLRSICAADGWLYAGGIESSLLRSKDGNRWSQIVAPGWFGIDDLVCTDQSVIAVGCGGVFTFQPNSGRGIIKSLAGNPSLRAIAVSDHRYVAVGRDGAIVTRLKASEESDWERVVSGTHRILQGVAHGHGRFVAVGLAGLILVSEDGRRWNGL
jgi:hypothetical protein